LVDAGKARITGFEPNAEECQRLNEAYGGTHRFFPHFVGDGKPAVFHETNWVLTGSLLEPNQPLLEKFQNLNEVTTLVARHPVNTVRLDDLTDLGSIDFIKIDIQGGELAVFQNALRVLAGALAIQTEVEFVEMYKRQPMFADVDIFLRDRGFQFHTFTGFGMRAFKPLVVGGNPNMGLRQYLWSDAIYVRDWMALDYLSEAKLKKLAVIANDILSSFDLAHLILVALDKNMGSDFASRYLQEKCG
jgi:FkbM family methyltransferase